MAVSLCPDDWLEFICNSLALDGTGSQLNGGETVHSTHSGGIIAALCLFDKTVTFIMDRVLVGA